MGRQLPPSHLKVPPGPHAFPQRYSLGDTVIVNQFSGIEKAIPAIPSLPGFRTSAGMFTFGLWWSCDLDRHDVKNQLLEMHDNNMELDANTSLQRSSHL